MKNDIMSPCEEFDLILRDNEDQRVHLKGILFNLLSEKLKIVVKESEIKAPSERKKIRLSSSKKKSQSRDDKENPRGSIERK